MRPVKDFLPSIASSKPQPEPSSTVNTSVRADRVWQRLAEIYGSTLVANFGAEPPLTWVRAIETLDDAQVIRALEACAKDASQYPPSLGQFRSWAKPPWQPPVVVPQLPKPRNVELARSTLGALKKRLRGG